MYAVRGTTENELVSASLNRMGANLLAWAKVETKAGRKASPPGRLTANMIGKRNSTCTMGGAEANTVLAWVVLELSPKLPARLVIDCTEKWESLRECGRALYRAVQVFREHKGKPRRTVCQDR